jgi:ATP-dependent protease ClpP protease subunit
MEILTIENKAGKVKLNESVYKESVDKLLEEIGSVFGARAVAEGADFGVLMNSAENAADTMEFEIHSPGGSILDGYRVYQAIMDLRGRGVYVTAFINSLAASMASVIAMAADEIKIVKGGRMMIHEASTATWGNAEDHARAAKLLDEMSGEIAGIYAERTGKKPSEMRERMKDETYMSAESAVAEGFADEVVSGKFDTKPKDKGMNILDRLTSPASAEALAEIDTLKAEVSNRESEVAELSNKVTVAEAALQEAATATAELRNNLATVNARVTELEAIAARVPELEAAAVVTAEKIANGASQLAASIGLPNPLADAGNSSTAETSKTPNLDMFNSLTGAERSAFYNANQEAIRKEITV